MRKTSFLAAGLLVAACGRSNGDSLGQPDGGYAAYRLALVGTPVLTVHPNEKRTLQVALAQDQIGGVANADIAFEFQDGDPNRSAVDIETARTNADGVATVHFTAGANSPRGFKLVATAPKYPEARPVAFSIRVIPVQRLLQIVGGPQVTVVGDHATVTLYTSNTAGLRVRELDKDTGQPIAGDTISFALPDTARSHFGSDANAKRASAVTNAAGEVQVFVLSTATTEPPILVTAQTASPGAQNSLSFTLNVQLNGTGQACTSTGQCPAGTICLDNKCTTDTGGGTCGAGTDNTCKFGEVCVGGVCVPPSQYCSPDNPNSCPTGKHCECTTPGTPSSCACVDDCPTECPAGTHCNPGTRTCDNNGSAPPDVTGVWFTRHVYDISQALPKPLPDIGKVIRLIDQAIVGKLSWPSWVPKWIQDYLDKLISSILKQYIPPWVQTVVRILDDVFTILTTLRSEGAMRLHKNPVDPLRLQGTEVWTSLVFYWLGLCGDNIGGDPDVPPECARFDVSTSDNDNPTETPQCKGQSIPSITVKVGPITGVLAGTGAAADPYQVKIDNRKIELEMGKVVLIVVNQLLSLTTPYNCIQEATDCNGGQCIVDCAGLGQDLANLVGIPDLAGVVEGICNQGVTLAGQEVTRLLAGIKFDTNALEFTGGAKVLAGGDPDDCESKSSCASQLGSHDFEVKLKKDRGHRDGQWTGSFFYNLLKNMPGAWEGTRQPVH